MMCSVENNTVPDEVDEMCNDQEMPTSDVKSEATADHSCSDEQHAYSCSVCLKQFTRKGSLNRHRARKHTHEEIRYLCPHCEKQFVSAGDLTRHVNIHTDKYRCTECGKCCASGFMLAVHQRSHSGEKPFECYVCGKRFRQSGSLGQHSQSHSSDKQFRCPVCAKAFTHLRSIKTHLRVHTGEKPHQCSVCGVRFRQSCHLQKHQLRQHADTAPH